MAAKPVMAIEDFFDGFSESRRLFDHLAGEPSHYNRFNCKDYPRLFHKVVTPDIFLVQSFTIEAPQGIAHFHDAFIAAG